MSTLAPNELNGVESRRDDSRRRDDCKVCVRGGAAISTRTDSTGRMTEIAATPSGPSPSSLREALKESTDLFPHVRVARDYEVLRQIGCIRHRQYVANQGKPYGSLVIDTDCLIELSDFSSVNIYARDGQGITSAMRIGEVGNEHNPYHLLFEEAARRFDLPVNMALTFTRLVRAPHHSGRHVVDLIRFVRWQAVRAGWRYGIMQTTEKLVPFFRKFEFFETGIWSDDAAAGRLQVLIIDTKMQPVQQRETSDA